MFDLLFVSKSSQLSCETQFVGIRPYRIWCINLSFAYDVLIVI